jgi:hypothetical protein
MDLMPDITGLAALALLGLVLTYPLGTLFAFVALLGHAVGPRELSAGWRFTVWLFVLAMPSTLVLLYHAMDFQPVPPACPVAWMMSMLILTICLMSPRWLYSVVAVLAGAIATAVAAGYALAVMRENARLLPLPPVFAAVNLGLLTITLIRCRLAGLHDDTRTGPGLLQRLIPINDTYLSKELNMTGRRFFAIIVIFAAVSGAWFLLGGSMWARTEMLDDELSGEIASLTGPKVVAQPHPYWRAKGDGAEMIVPASADIAADIQHENRYKGLLWYSTFTVDFRGVYTLAADADGGEGNFHFQLPYETTPIDLLVEVDGKAIELPTSQKTSGELSLPMDRTSEHTVTVAFKTMGQDVWAYYPAGALDNASNYSRTWTDAETLVGDRGELKNFTLNVTTDFEDIDYPSGGRSPNQPASDSNGGKLASWQYDSLIAAQPMGVLMPKRANAGPIVARMSFFAPVSLLFFFTVLFTVVVKKGIALHPMHYLFIAAGFFAFHILLAYTADQISIHLAFWISAVVSVLLVVSYLRLVTGAKFAITYAGAAQLIYLVGFSYAFFWVGMTGLTITVVAIITLFVLMQATGRLDWQTVFKSEITPPPMPASTGVHSGDVSADTESDD